MGNESAHGSDDVPPVSRSIIARANLKRFPRQCRDPDARIPRSTKCPVKVPQLQLKSGPKPLVNRA